MRELKFRIMYKKYPNIWLKEEHTLRDLIEIDGNGFLNDDDIIEQSTGLKDKNGKEIYEGDIVKLVRKTPENKSTIYQVIWDSFCTGFDLDNLDCSKTDIGYLNEFTMEEDYEVIGNIHENPELLKGEE